MTETEIIKIDSRGDVESIGNLECFKNIDEDTANEM